MFGSACKRICSYREKFQSKQRKLFPFNSWVCFYSKCQVLSCCKRQIDSHFLCISFINNPKLFFPPVTGHGGRSSRDHANLGHRRPGAVPILGSGFLPRCRLLRPRLRRDCPTDIQSPGQLEGRIPHPGLAKGPRQFPIRSIRKQDRLGEQDGE